MPLKNQDITTRPEKVQAIIESAYMMTGEKGCSAASMAEIAQAAGVSKSLLHYYFKDKEELLLEVYRYALDKYQAIGVAALLRPAPIAERLRNLFQTFQEFISDNPLWFKVIMELTLYGVRNAETRKEILDRHLFLREIVADVIRDSRITGECAREFNESVLSSLMLAMANGFAFLHTIARDASDFTRLSAYFLRMMTSFLDKDHAL